MNNDVPTSVLTTGHVRHCDNHNPFRRRL